jgi:hypothetical protein
MLLCFRLVVLSRLGAVTRCKVVFAAALAPCEPVEAERLLQSSTLLAAQIHYSTTSQLLVATIRRQRELSSQ